MRRDLGDFQTPPALAAAVLDRLDSLGVARDRVFEPTCGRGHFVSALLDRPIVPREIRGFEIQPEHCDAASGLGAEGTLVVIEQADLFEVDLSTRLAWTTTGRLLVLGNPPWVTSAALSRIGGENRPARVRVAGLDGLDARTGRANFDLAEAVWHKLLTEFDQPGTTLALLCKTTTARNVLRWADRTARPIASASIHRIDTRLWFGAAVDACLMVVSLGERPPTLRVDVYPDLTSDRPETTIGVVAGQLVADLDAFDSFRFAFGRFAQTWRQGVKHDAARVMELVERDGRLWNGLGEVVDVEPDRVFPLVKGADLGRERFVGPSRSVIVTQDRLGEDTTTLRDRAPRLWSYLQAHADVFAARRSKVYDGKSPFAMFGVGEYTFAPYKVAISGLCKTSRFHAIGPSEGRPVMFDDTSYFLPCDDGNDARRWLDVLNAPIAQALIQTLRFGEAKRPITKAILQRIDLDAIERHPPLATAVGVG